MSATHKGNHDIDADVHRQQQRYQKQQQGIDESSSSNSSAANGQPPNIRHIPIYVEGRDEPLVNRNNIENHPSPGGRTQTPSADYHQHQQQQQQLHYQQQQVPSSKSSGGIFDRVKHFPTIINHKQSAAERTNSPHRTHSVPMNVQRSSSSGGGGGGGSSVDSVASDYQSHHQSSSQAERTPSETRNPDMDAIVKIQSIQRDVLNLMDQVERFSGYTRKDRQYIYLDEMLTQNLLKLDTIDADGKENIKNARREAIKCINKCIAVLEAKADSCPSPTQQQQHGNYQWQQQQQQHHGKYKK